MWQLTHVSTNPVLPYTKTCDENSTDEKHQVFESDRKIH